MLQVKVVTSHSLNSACRVISPTEKKKKMTSCLPSDEVKLPRRESFKRCALASLFSFHHLFGYLGATCTHTHTHRSCLNSSSSEKDDRNRYPRSKQRTAYKQAEINKRQKCSSNVSYLRCCFIVRGSGGPWQEIVSVLDGTAG